jgi:VWFA-related protein
MKSCQGGTAGAVSGKAGSTKRLCLAIVAVWLLLTDAGGGAGASPWPQSVPQVPGSGVELIQLDVVVTGPQGQTVSDLTASDFEVIDEGASPPIARFAYEPGVGDPGQGVTPDWWPRTLSAAELQHTAVIVVDELELSSAGADRLRASISRVASDLMGPGDLVAVIPVCGAPAVSTRLTAIPARVRSDGEWIAPCRAQPAALGWYRAYRSQGLLEELRHLLRRSPEPARPHLRGEAFATFVHLAETIDELGPIPGRKAVIFMTERGRGKARGSAEQDQGWVHLIADAARRSRALVYGVQIGTGSRETARPSSGWLAQLASETGGLAWLDTNDVDRALDAVWEDQQRGHYLLGFRSAHSGPPAYHEVGVRVRRAGVEVRSRGGFYVPSLSWTKPSRSAPASQGAEPLGEVMTQALHSPLVVDGMRVRMRPIVDYDRWGKGVLKVEVRVVPSPGVPSTQRRDGAWIQIPGWFGPGRQSRESLAPVDLEGAALCFASDGTPVATQRTEVAMPSSRRRGAAPDGIPLELELGRLAAGEYLVQAAVQDRTTGRLGSARAWVAVDEVGYDPPTLSSLLLWRGSSLPRERQRQISLSFQAGDVVSWALRVYGKLKPEACESRCVLYGGGVEISRTPPQPLHWSKVQGAFLLEGSLHLSAHLPPGDYALQVIITEHGLRQPLDQLALLDIVG